MIITDGQGGYWQAPDGTPFDSTLYSVVEERMPGEPYQSKQTVDAADLGMTLRQELANMKPVTEGLFGPSQGSGGTGAMIGGVAGSMTPFPYVGSIAGSAVGQAVEDYLRKGEVSPGNAAIAGGTQAIGLPLAAGTGLAASGLIRQYPLLARVLGMEPNLVGQALKGSTPISMEPLQAGIAKAESKVANAATNTPLADMGPRLADLQARLSTPTSGATDPASAFRRMGMSVPQWAQEMSAKSSGAIDLNRTPAQADELRQMVGSMMDVPKAANTGIPSLLYAKYWDAIRDAAAAGNPEAQLLIKNALEQEALNVARNTQFKGLETLTRGGIGYGLGYAAHHPLAGAMIGLGLPLARTAGNLANVGLTGGNVGVSGLNPYAAGAAGLASQVPINLMENPYAPR